jgi:imidazole glycerol-phosphate synthase subunit HisH
MIAIVDYDMGNLGSIRNMLRRIGAEPLVTSSREDLDRADRLVLPRVGAFDQAVQNLRRLDLVAPLNRAGLERRVPVLGICLGMQLMSRRSDEGVLPGLGWIDAETVRFQWKDEEPRLPLPHMGWNTIAVQQENSLLPAACPDERYYFVHSFHVRCNRKEDILATTCYGTEFVSAVIRENLFGTQFHPEKSHRFGMHLLKNFLEG